ncbi:peptide ABC transporter ATP-binding protein [Planctobacterium marinum]|uniref:peptide ABC transporter ATP-binding protein n=1 Tax=Planctobacterium marinum TaxID=1631968 RepID=UPI001E5507A9|nr:ATP-binding cassette domain-containing protein [Planctobacterium marinum]MCC2605502.1 ATP-binding cassette domain-containing protein [Planctobacterium marinum]
MTALLTVKNLKFKRKVRKNWWQKAEKFVIGPINFELNAGETLAIIGDNGSGKSTLANLLAGVVTPSSGQLLLNGQKLRHRNLKQRSLNIRMIFQHSKESLNPALTVGTILDEPLKLNTNLDARERKEKISTTLRQVGLLREHAHFYRHMLSDGQRQRVVLARALILNPQVIVADEPFAALDPSVRSQMVNLLMRLQRELGLSYIFISHNLGIVRHISDRVLVLQNGKVIESGKTDVVFNWPKSDYMKKLLTAHQSLVLSKLLD